MTLSYAARKPPCTIGSSSPSTSTLSGENAAGARLTSVRTSKGFDISVPRNETTTVLSATHRHTAACVSVLTDSTKQTFSKS